jgi:hypothetical protein
MAIETTTGISVQNVIELLHSLSSMVAILAVGFTLVGAIAVWRTSKDGAWAFFRMFERLQVLQMLTVMLVIASATILAMLGILNSNGVTGILSGVAGYVLGGLSKQGTASQSGETTTASQEQKP